VSFFDVALKYETTLGIFVKRLNVFIGFMRRKTENYKKIIKICKTKKKKFLKKLKNTSFVW
jgi:hypothetical protein